MRFVSETKSPKEVLQWARGFVKQLGDHDLQSYYLPKLPAGLGFSEAEWRQVLPEPGRTPDTTASGTRLEACKPAQLDRDLLAFAVRFPEYHGELHALGLGAALATDRGRVFWKKIFGANPHDVLSTLDQGEKQFYVQCQMRADVTADDGRGEWDEIREFLQQNGRRRELDSLNAGLRKARLEGDFQEELRLLALIQTKRQG
jgi:DNA primase